MTNPDQHLVPLSLREIATVLCALRSIQDRLDGFPSRQCHAPESLECDHFHDHRPLSAEDIDALCEHVGGYSLVDIR
jgi:hypothetical protein